MSRKHFNQIAETIKTCIARENEAFVADGDQAIKDLARNLAADFADFNPNFDRNRFLAACGITD